MTPVEVATTPSVSIYFTHSKRKYRKALARYDTKPNFGNNDGETTYVENPDGADLFIVWMRKNLDQSAEADVEILAHEATHIVDDYFRYKLGEHSPSEEFRAYATGKITRFLIDRHYAWKRKRLEKR